MESLILFVTNLLIPVSACHSHSVDIPMDSELKYEEVRTYLEGDGAGAASAYKARAANTTKSTIVGTHDFRVLRKLGNQQRFEATNETNKTLS